MGKPQKQRRPYPCADCDTIVVEPELLCFVCQKKMDTWRKERPHRKQKSVDAYHSGMYAMGQNKYYQAKEYFSEAVELDKTNAEAYYQRALTRARLDDPIWSVKVDLDQAIYHNPYFAPAYRMRANINSRINSLSQSMSDGHRAIAYDIIQE